MTNVWYYVRCLLHTVHVQMYIVVLTEETWMFWSRDRKWYAPTWSTKPEMWYRLGHGHIMICYYSKWRSIRIYIIIYIVIILTMVYNSTKSINYTEQYEYE